MSERPWSDISLADYEKMVLQGVKEEADKHHPVRSKYALVVFTSNTQWGRDRKPPKEVIFVVDKESGECWHVDRGDPTRNGLDSVVRNALEGNGDTDMSVDDFLELLGYYEKR